MVLVNKTDVINGVNGYFSILDHGLHRYFVFLMEVFQV